MLRTLLPVSADGYGPSYTCTSLLAGLERNGLRTKLFVNRYRKCGVQPDVAATLPTVLNFLPYLPLKDTLTQVTARRFVRSFSSGDIAYLWPGSPLEVYQRVKDLGVPLAVECVNSKMSHAKRILDAAYEELNLNKGHGITDDRVELQNKKLELADAIFSPSPFVSASLADRGGNSVIMESSYGFDPSRAIRHVERPVQRSVRFLFCGFGSVRKGFHVLLEAWNRMPQECTLRIVGSIELALLDRYRKVLYKENVERVGFTRDVEAHYSASDVLVLPSLEEGDPLVVYEAAAHGLAIVATEAGVGRLAADTGCALTVPPRNPGALLDAMMALHDDRSFLRDWANAARSSVQPYSWNEVSKRRAPMVRSLTDLSLMPRSLADAHTALPRMRRLRPGVAEGV